MPTIVYAHIEFTKHGTPFITGTRTKVEEVVLAHLAHNWDAAEIHRQYPYLSLAAIHSALAYYYDHEAEMNQMIEEGIREVRDIQSNVPASAARQRLKAKGLLP